jgi:GH35 family endo-1,4-beta-xylanase
LGLPILLILICNSCGGGEEEEKYPPIENGKGRIIFALEPIPETIITKEIADKFLIGVGTTDKEGWVDSAVLKNLRINGINYFLPFTSWASIEVKKENYSGNPCPGENLILWLINGGAVMNGHCLLFLMDEEWLIPKFAKGYSFTDQKIMVEKFIKTTVARFPKIGIWTLNEPIVQNGLNWSRDQIYETFVCASKWIHEVNPKAKVMVNMIPISVNWSGLEYDPNTVLDNLLERGMEVDIIGIELYDGWAPAEELDINGYPGINWIKSKVAIFRKYNLPIIFSEVGMPGRINGKDQYDKQADWMESFFRSCHVDEDIIGATWYFVRDERDFPFAGLMNDNYTQRPVCERLIKLANEWNPPVEQSLNGQKYLDISPGEYDVIVNQEIFRINVLEGETVTIGQ